ncbi:CRISPR-associated ring nuclease Csm6 [Vibrio metschnikovii]|uniref:CRISPR-associated ring nuclease Csm6 n=1 Tax=Vibrio metschnikovii TaxID=28172 RepID=UPI002FC9BB5A
MSTKQHVLLAVSGMTPQIITETLFGIYRQDPTKVPQRIEVITTQDGRQRLIANLLGPDSPLEQLIKDYQLPSIRFTPEDIKVPEGDDGALLNDIKSERDQEIITNFITDHVRQLSQDPNIIIHASLAGGRKTMGFALGYAMSLFGRPEDSLSHVLVSEPYESIPDFYYPTPNTVMRADRDKKSQHDLSKAQVMLAKIPLVLMREEMPTSLINEPSLSYTDTVARINRANALSQETATVTLNYDTMSICCDGVNIALKPDCFAFYSWIAQDSKENFGDGIDAPREGMKEAELDQRLAQFFRATAHPARGMDTELSLEELNEQASDTVFRVIDAERCHDEASNTPLNERNNRNRWLLQENKQIQFLYANHETRLQEKNDDDIVKALVKYHKSLWVRLLKETNMALTDALGARLAKYYQIVTVNTYKPLKCEVVRTPIAYKGLNVLPENIHFQQD